MPFRDFKMQFYLSSGSNFSLLHFTARMCINNFHLKKGSRSKKARATFGLLSDNFHILAKWVGHSISGEILVYMHI
jgi:hypothetical protein